MKPKFLSLTLLSLCLSAFPLFSQEQAYLTQEDYFDIESVSQPQISPDGKHILYVRSWINKYEDKSESEIWIMNTDGSDNRFFLKGSQPVWSPDGSKFVFVRNGEPRGSQIFVRYMNLPGPETQLSRLDETPGNLKWSPDGKYLAFTMLVPESDKWKIEMPSRPEGAKWTAEPRIIDDLVYRRDRVGFLEEGYQHIFVMSSEGGLARKLTAGEWNHGSSGFSWSADAKEIYFSSLRVPDAEYIYRESEIYAVSLESGEIRQLTSRKGPDFDPVVSPDNRWIAYRGYDWTDDAYINAGIYLMRTDGTGTREIAKGLDRPVSNITWANDGSGIYFNVDNHGTRNLVFAGTGGEMKNITSGKHMLTVNSISKSGMAAGVLTDPSMPGEIVVFPLGKAVPRYLTSVNRDLMEGKKLGKVEEMWFKSLDDFDIQAWYILPPDFDSSKKYPLILTIHGGPHAMYNVGFNFRWQQHAAEGYVVLYINPRGSTGYGSAFANAIKNDYPNKDYHDLMRGVDEMLDKGFVDENNLFVYGGSGGGVLTSWIVGHTNRFAAASVNYPVIDWLSFVGTTDGVSWYYNFEKYPWEDPSEHLRRSPLMYVGNVATPTLLMTGVNDLRTPISQTEEFYQALKVRKVPTAMIRFNDEYHGTSSKPSNYLRTTAYLHYWFDKFSK